MGSRGSDWKPAEQSQWHYPLSNPSPTYSVTTQRVGCPALVNTYGSTPCYTTGAPPRQKKKMAQMKKQFIAPEKIQLHDEEIANLSDTQFKTLVIRMLQELNGYFNSIKKTQATKKVTLWEIKKNLQGINCDRKETRTQINGLEQKEEINVLPEQNEETRIQKKKKIRTGLGTSWTTLNVTTSESCQCQKEKSKSKKLKTYLKT